MCVKHNAPEGTYLTFQAPVTLPFNAVPLTSLEVLHLKWSIILWSLIIVCQRILLIFSRNGFHFSGLSDLDLWPWDPKLSRCHLLKVTNHPYRFEYSSPKGSHFISKAKVLWLTNRRKDKHSKNNMPQIIWSRGI